MTRSFPATPLARRRTVLGAALLASAALSVGLLSACGSGQITQTDRQVSAVPGVSGTSADGKIALRQGLISYADEYKTGATVPLEVYIFNNSRQAVKLTGVTARQGGAVVLVGGASPTPSPATTSASPSASATATATASGSAKAGSASPTAASPSPTQTSVGSSKIDVTIPVDGFVALTKDTKTYLAFGQLQSKPLRAGDALSGFTFTFTYADGTTTTLTLDELPMGVPLSPLPKPSSVVEHKGEE